MTASRRQGDPQGRHYTDPRVARAIVGRLVSYALLGPRCAVRSRVVLEPSAGAGAFLDAVHAADPASLLHAVDLDPEAPALVCPAFLPYRTHLGDCLQPLPDGWPERWHLILGNPPYSTKGPSGRWQDAATPQIRHFMKRADHVVQVLRFGYFGLPKGADHPRRAFLLDGPAPREIWPLWPRPSFSGDGRTDASEYCAAWWDNTAGAAGATRWIPLRWDQP